MKGHRLVIRHIPGQHWVQFWGPTPIRRWGEFGRDTIYHGIVQRLRLGPLTVLWLPR